MGGILKVCRLRLLSDFSLDFGLILLVNCQNKENFMSFNIKPKLIGLKKLGFSKISARFSQLNKNLSESTKKQKV